MTNTATAVLAETPVRHIVPRIGDPFPQQGGILAGTMRGDDGSLYNLILCPEAEAGLGELEWGGYGKEEPGATSTWDGLANTRALIASEHSHPAAEKVAALVIGGFDDYYLPAQREMALLWATVPHLLQKDWYWSSTQYGRYLAWYQLFSYGNQYDNGKNSEFRAVAVRRSAL